MITYCEETRISRESRTRELERESTSALRDHYTTLLEEQRGGDKVSDEDVNFWSRGELIRNIIYAEEDLADPTTLPLLKIKLQSLGVI